jgi:hypothetical protein
VTSKNAGELEIHKSPIANRQSSMARLTNTLVKTCRPDGRRYISVQNRALTQKKMFKYDVRSRNVYENKETDDNMSIDKSGFLHENAPVARGSSVIRRALWPKMHRLRDKSGQRLTLNQLIGPSIHRRSTELVSDGPMTRTVVSD